MVNAAMVGRLLTCVQFSGSARQYFKFRVTSAQNHLGSEPLLNNGTGVKFRVIHFSVSLLLSVGHPLIYCQNQMFMYPGSVTIRSIYRGCRIRSRISLKWVQILQMMARLVTFTQDFTEMPVKMIFVSWGSSEHGGSRELHELSLEPRKECHTKILPGSEKKNCQRLPNRGIARVCQNKITVSEYNNQKY